MRAQLKEMYSLQIPENLADFRPAEAGNFGISVRLMVGLEGHNQSESFDIFVCTPTWIQDQLREGGPMWGRHLLIALEYDYENIRKTLAEKISSCTGKDWDEVAMKLARFLAWEFEDYQPLA